MRGTRSSIGCWPRTVRLDGKIGNIQSRPTMVHVENQLDKKMRIEQLLAELLADAELNSRFGEFGITFTVQNGKIGHFEEYRRETFK